MNCIVKENRIIIPGTFRIKVKDEIIDVNEIQYNDFMKFFIGQFKKIKIENKKEDITFIIDEIDLSKVSTQNLKEALKNSTLKICCNTNIDNSINEKMEVCYKKRNTTSIGIVSKIDNQNYKFNYDDNKNNLKFIHNFLKIIYAKQSDQKEYASSRKISGNLSTLLVKKYIEDMLKKENINDCYVSLPNVYIDGCNTEYDLLILKGKEKNNSFGIYNSHDVIVAIEVKANGLFCNQKNDGKEVDDTFESALNFLSNADNEIKYLFISLIENEEYAKREKEDLGNLEQKKYETHEQENKKNIITSSLILTIENNSNNSDTIRIDYDISKQLKDFINK